MSFLWRRAQVSGLPTPRKDMHKTLYPIARMRGWRPTVDPRGTRAAFPPRVGDCPRRVKDYIKKISN